MYAGAQPPYGMNAVPLECLSQGVGGTPVGGSVLRSGNDEALAAGQLQSVDGLDIDLGDTPVEQNVHDLSQIIIGILALLIFDALINNNHLEKEALDEAPDVADVAGQMIQLREPVTAGPINEIVPHDLTP